MKSKITSIFQTTMLLVSCVFLPLVAQEEQPEIGIIEKLGQNVPAELTFNDENNKKVALKEVINKPTILALVYYRCPGICTPLLNELQKTLEKLQMNPGKDFHVLTISFDPTETAEVASAKKQNYLQGMSRPFPQEAWSFFTGDENSVTTIKQAVGYNTQFDEKRNEYLHEGALIILSPEGKITRYLYLTKGFLPLDVQMALVEAKEGKVNPSIPKYAKWCESKDRARENKERTLMITTIAGAAILVVLGSLVAFVVLKGNKS